MANQYQVPRKTVATVTSNSPAVAGTHIPVDASAAAVTIALPGGKSQGSHLSIEKVDSSTNTVTVSGSIRGNANASITLSYQYETLELVADSGGSWRPIANHLPKSAVDKKIADQATVDAGAYATKTDVAGKASLADVDSRVAALPAATSVQSLPLESGYSLAIVDAAGRPLLTFGADGAASFVKGISVPAGTITLAQLSAAVQANLNQAIAAEAGLAMAVTDAAGRVLISIALDGTTSIPKLILAAGSITQAMLSAGLQSALPGPLGAEAGLLEAWTDAAGRLYAGTRADGSRFSKGIPASPAAVSANYVVTVEPDGNGSARLFSTNRTTGTRVQLTTTGQASSPVLDANDQVLFRSDLGNPAGRHAHLWVPAAGGPVYPAFSSTDAFYCVGDSLTAGTGASVANTGYPRVLANLLGKSVINDGSGGQTSSQIAARQGGTPATITFASNTIAATTAAQTVTASLDLLYGAAGAYSRPGTIGGVHGTLAATGQNTLTAYTFTRDTAGAAVALSGPTPFIPDALVNSGSLVAGLWAGRNDFKTVSAATIVGNVQSMVSALRAYQKRYWVLSIPPDSGEVTGTGVRSQLDAANAALQAAFPNSWIDGAGYLRTDAAFALAGITKTSQDATDIANGVTPTSFRADSVHLNDSGYLVIGTLVRQFLTQKGWA